MKRVFINDYGFTHDWIMGKIADDIMTNAQMHGYECRCGNTDDYDGEDICYHLSFKQAIPIPQAKHNSVFYTHLNTVMKEINLIGLKDKFDSFVCMSPEDAEFLIELGFDKTKVFGRILPVRNTYIKPISVGIFSACYVDGRKNEEWILDYCSKNEAARNINFVFIGQGWGKVVASLEKLGCSFEWHNVSRKMPYEYQFQQNKLASLNYYIYMGMDGGAMGAYDAYAQDVPLCITYDGFHKAIKDIDYAFDNKETFFEQFDKIVSKHANRLDFFQSNNQADYVSWLIDIWEGKGDNKLTEADKSCISYKTVVDKKRDQYYDMKIGGIKGYLAYKFKRLINKKIKSDYFKR